MEPLKVCGMFVHFKYIFCTLILLWSTEFMYAEILEDEGCNTCIKLKEDELDITTFSVNKSKLYYRYLTIEDDNLYSGAMNHVFKFNLKNISEPIKQIKLEASDSSKGVCKLYGKDEDVVCQNHIRFIATNTSSNQLFVCGTGSYSPRRYSLFRENLTLVDSTLGAKGIDGKGWCPFDPFDNATAVFVESNNPYNASALYTAAWADSRKSQPAILRPKLFKDNKMVADFVTFVSDPNWLNVPQYIASFDLGHQVLFFFRETALEYTNCGKKIYSRVARVCKSDRGGQSVLKSFWTSFVKARLNCSIPGSFPYYFDEIQDVYTIDKKRFYALFTTNNNGLTASAICEFSINEINAAFDGPFKGQENKTSQWLPVPSSKVPVGIHPRNCATMNSTSYSDDVLNFIKARTLMDKTVAHKYGRPIFYKANCLMQKLAVDQAMDKRTDSISSLVFYTATNKGEVYKIFVRLTENKEPEFYISSNYVPFANGEAIWSFKKHGSYLYMGSDSAIKQLNIKTCKKYREIDNCVLDPNCGWNGISGCCEERTNDNTFLLSHENLTSISDINEITKDISKTENLLDHNEEKVGKGIPYTIPVKYKLCVRGPVTWEFKPLEGAYRFEKVVLDSAHKITRSHDNTLVITNITSEHEGVYIARDNLNRIVSKHTVRVMDTEQDIDREWKIQFNDWSREFNEFKKLREKCSTSCCTPGK